jgi:hypothetical protein
MAKKKWFTILTNLFSKINNRNHRNSPTRTRSPSRKVNRRTSPNTMLTPTRTVNRRTSHTTIQTPTRTINRRTSRTTSRTIIHSNPNTLNHTRTRNTIKNYSQLKSNSKSVHRPHSTRKSASKKNTYNLNKLKPKGTVLFKEDFKCIFCFQLPKLPADEKRGIIICPHCRHPAHADEFKSWLKSSRLCSRCDRPLSISFIQNIEIIPTPVYIKAMKIIMKKRR